MQDIAYTVHIFREGETFVSYVPELDVSSCGATNEEARHNIRDAVQGFLESCAAMGSLDSVLEESGYKRKDEMWQPPEFIGIDRQRASVA